MVEIILAIIGIIVYGTIVIGPGLINQKLEKIKHCSDKELPGALLIFLLIKHRATLAEISNHFLRPMDEIKKVLDKSTHFKMIEGSFDDTDPGWEMWTFA